MHRSSLALLGSAFAAVALATGLHAQAAEDPPAPVEPTTADDAETATADAEAEEAEPGAVRVIYGAHGLEIRSADGNYRAWFTLRAQLRVSYPIEGDPIEPEDFDAEEDAVFAIQRARFKWGGHALRPWLDYYLEYEIRRGTLLDLRFTFEKWEAFQLRLGQWKAEYNRERRDSSGEQQLVDRSIANRVFTLDRQSGLMANGRLWEGTRADSHWWLGAFSGEGLGNYATEGAPLWTARWQWNFTGRELEFSQSDVERKSEPHGSLAVAAARNRSRYTRFSTDGGGELEGFPSDVAERWEIEQAVADAGWQYRGFSFQAELHRKTIEDRAGDLGVSRFVGGYAQVGYFFHGVCKGFPEPLELAVRVARVDADEAPSGETGDEATLGANWFFSGHRNKLSADVSHLALEAPGFDDSLVRFRFQWDVSF